MRKKAIFICASLLLFATITPQAQVLKKLKKAAEKTLETVDKTEKNIKKVEDTKNAIQNEVEATKNSIQNDVNETVGTKTTSSDNSSLETTQSPSSVNSISQSVKHDGKAIYVSRTNGDNGNDGSRNAPF